VNVLLLSMPDSFEHMAPVAIRMPNGGLSSLAGNVDPHHRVAVADLILVQRSVRETVTRLVRELAPDLVGLSVMTFQRRTALKVVALVRALRPSVKVVVGGYDPSLAREAYTGPDSGVDFIVRGEGEATFHELIQALENGKGSGLEGVCGLSWRDGAGFRHNPDRPVHRLARGGLRLPNRGARVLTGYAVLGRQADVIETSRGCTFDCSFCSIIEMRGRNFHAYPIERVLDDIRDARAHGARAIFIIDDNVTLDVKRFEELCRAIVDAGLNRIEYTVQAMTSAIADHGETLGPLMRQAGFRYVFLGIENVLEDDLAFLRAKTKNAKRENGLRAGNASQAAVDVIHRNGMYVVGGLIVGNPGDTRASVEANLEFARRYVDWPYIQHPTPYPRTPMTLDLARKGMILSDRLEEWDGTTAVIRTEHLSPDEVEFMRWKAERWMKLRHFPVALRRDPLFCLRHGPQMIRHTLRGMRWKSWLGLESERAAFARFRQIRAVEREYLTS
jgi:radical SAM superfamily enzyme YgiQ (UPF0313 family)